MGDDNTNSTPAPVSSGAPDVGLDPRLKKLYELAQTPHKELQQPTVNPKATNPSLGQDIGVGLLNMFVPFLGQAIQRHSMVQKQAQVNEAFQDFKQLHDSLEEAWMLSGGDQKKAFQLWEQMPGYKDIFDPANPASKKKLKNYAKVFSIDWMNPEKTKSTAQYQGLQKFMDVYPQSKLVKALHGKMQSFQQQGQGAQQMTQGAQGVAGQGGQQGEQSAAMGQRLPMHMSQPSPQIMEQLLKMGQQGDEFKATFMRLREEHAANLDQKVEALNERADNHQMMHQDRLDRLDMMQQQFGENKKLKEERDAEISRHNKEMEALSKERNGILRDLGNQRLDIANEKLKNSKLGGKLKEEYKAGLRVLHASLYGSGDPGHGGTKGLVDTLGVLDSQASRFKLATLANDFLHPQEGGAGAIKGLKMMMESKLLNENEREYIRQLNRSIGAINALRTVTGLPRATQQLMERYVLELPNALMDVNSKEAVEKLTLIQREIGAALDKDIQDAEAAEQGDASSKYSQYKRTETKGEAAK